MADIRPFIKNHLLEPLKHYNTVIQDTMIEIITQRLQELYDYTLKFPEIVTPNKNRLDILKAIADQFLFTVREDADIDEQVNILENILYVYNRRGSIDTIENMWKYYGGKLPKDVKVVIPSYNLFRYSISKFSGTHVFQDNAVNRTGVYEIRLTNNTYPIPDLREFLIKELVAAGNLIYFTNTLHTDILNSDASTNAYKYNVHEYTHIDTQMSVLKAHQGLTWSGYNPLSKKSEDSAWSGRGSIFLELTLMFDLDYVLMDTYMTYQSMGILVEYIKDAGEITYRINLKKNYEIFMNNYLYCTPRNTYMDLLCYSYDSQGNLIESRYPGYFILGESLLGEKLT